MAVHYALTGLGLLFFGIATPVEAAGVGSFGAIVVAVMHKRFSLKALREAFMLTKFPAEVRAYAAEHKLSLEAAARTLQVERFNAQGQLIAQEDRNGNRVTAGAGVTLPSLLRATKEVGLAGLEKLTGIPAMVGGAVAIFFLHRLGLALVPDAARPDRRGRSSSPRRRPG